ncbi:MAG: cutinase family protein [Solirubrobacteraceae bacterium]|nr:cutinase family protein [Solirubrobacteraceae bacterium]
MSRQPLLRRALAVGTIGLATLVAAPAAQAVTYDPWNIPSSETGTGVQANHCAKIEIVYARGTAEPAGNSWALNGYNYWGWHGTDYTGSSWKSPYSVFYTIAKVLGNDVKLADGSLKPREYVTVYDSSAGAALAGRSDFAHWNVPYQADLSFTTEYSSANSVQVGTKNLIDHLNAENTRCPSKKFLLFGYSQGSLVIANALVDRVADAARPAGTKSNLKYIYSGPTPLPTLNASAATAVKTAGLLADGGFNSTEKLPHLPAGSPAWLTAQYDRHFPESTIVPAQTPWNIDADTKRDLMGRRNAANYALTGTVRGQLESPPAGPAVGLRTNNWMLPRFADRIRSYCILQDPICNRSETDANAHLLYFNTQVPRQNLAIFAVQRLRDDAGSGWTRTGNGLNLGIGFPDRLTYEYELDSTVSP